MERLIGQLENIFLELEEMKRLFGEGKGMSSHKLKRLMEEEIFRRKNQLRFDSLTQREREVLQLVALGETNQKISNKLFVSIDTIRTHRNRIWQKLEITNLVGAIRFARAFDLV